MENTTPSLKGIPCQPNVIREKKGEDKMEDNILRKRKKGEETGRKGKKQRKWEVKRVKKCKIGKNYGKRER